MSQLSFKTEVRFGWAGDLMPRNKAKRLPHAAVRRSDRKLRADTKMAWLGAGRPTAPASATNVIMRFTRHAPRLYDDDNLTAQFKAIRDEVVDLMGFADDSHRSGIDFVYDQEKTTGGDKRISITVSWN